MYMHTALPRQWIYELDATLLEAFASGAQISQQDSGVREMWIEGHLRLPVGT